MRSLINNSKQSMTILVVAAAFFSLLGGSAVAGHLITGKSVKNSSLTGVDVKNSSLTGGDVRNGTIGPNDLNDAAKATLQGPTGATGTHGPMATVHNSTTRSRNVTTFGEPAGGSTPITVPQTATKLLITFSGECNAEDPANPSAQEIRFLVDGVAVNQAIYLCRNDADAPADDRRAAHSVQMPADVTPGDHTVSVEHRSTTAAGTVWLDDTTLSVITG